MKKLAFSFLLSLLISQSYALSFAIIGDFGSNNRGEAAVADLVRKNIPEFVITLGDNNYLNGCWSTIDKNIGQYYSNYIGNYKGSYGPGAKTNQFFPALGNHDWRAAELCTHHGNLPYLDYFTLPNNARYYDFVKGPVHFFVLDSDPHEPDGNSIGSVQYNWFKETITHSTSPFKIVYFHHASFSSAQHGDNTTMQWDFKALGADLVLSGHDHSYERIVRNGLTYIVNGIGGPNHLGYKTHDTKGSKVFYAKRYGFMMADVSDDKMSFRLINEKNKVIDKFTIEH